MGALLAPQPKSREKKLGRRRATSHEKECIFHIYIDVTYDKVLLREVPRGVAQGHIIISITTGRNDHLFVNTKKTCPEKKMNSHFTRSTSWVSTAVLLPLFGYSR